MNFEETNSLEQLNLNDFIVKAPYIPIQITKKEPHIIHMIIKAYTGLKSEFTSICQYTYQHFILSNLNNLKNISHILEEISIVEMKHLEILSQILVQMNVNPKFCTYIDDNANLCNFWSASNINYSNNIKDFIESNKKLEEIAIYEYSQIIDKTTDDNLKSILHRIIEDEEKHLLFFNTVLKILSENC